MIDVCNTKPEALLSISEALEKINAAIQPVDASEIVALKNAAGRMLSEPVYSPINLPYNNNAAMDGYALLSSDIDSEQAFTLPMAGTSWAGRAFTGHLEKGHCLRVFTGAVVPPQTDTVIMQEHVRAEGETIHFPAHVTAHQNIRYAGEDIQQGRLLLAPPKKLSPYDLALLASAGVDAITVKRQIRIAFFSTGDELIGLGQTIEPGKIYDSNRYLLNEFLKDPSYRVTDMGVVADDKKLLEDSLIRAAQDHDVVITTGGASVGDADYVQEILARCGQVSFWKLAIKPGKPLAFGRIGSCHFFGLPGNPVAVAVTFQQIVAPALKQLSGAPPKKALRLTATSTSRLKKAQGRLEFQRGILTQDDAGEFFVATSGHQGSHILGSMSAANCFILLPAECDGLNIGDKVLVEPFSVELPSIP